METKNIASSVAAKPVKAMKLPALIVGSALIQKAVDSIGRRSKGIVADIQLAGLSIIKHIDEHGDSTLADRLYIAMGKGSRRVSLAQWFIMHGKVRLLDKENGDDAAAIKAGRIFQFDKTRTTNMPGAMAQQWQDAKKEPELREVFDVHAAYLNLMKRIQAAKSKGITLEHAEWIEKLNAVAVPEVKG